jgi:hypothetical protein
VARHPFPGPGHDGDEPVPGVPARDWAAEDDRYLDWLTAEIDAGRTQVPPQEPSPGYRRKAMSAYRRGASCSFIEMHTRIEGVGPSLWFPPDSGVHVAGPGDSQGLSWPPLRGGHQSWLHQFKASEQGGDLLP